MPRSTGSRRKTAVVAAALFCVSAPAAFAQTKGYYNYPDIANGLVVFSAEDDLWTVPSTGGNATRLTRSNGTESMPRFSPDGSLIAFSGQYDGNTDVYVISINGGDPKRLTFHPYRDEPVAWSPDGQSVLHQTARGSALFSRRVWSVPVGGGVPELVRVGVASYLDIMPDGDTVVFNRNSTQGRTWKRYGGGTSEDIWYGSIARQEFRRLTEYFGQDSSPVFAGDRIWFASERDGRMNLWSFKSDASDLRQETFHKDFDVRWHQSDGKQSIVYQHGADIVLFDTATRKGQVIDINLVTDQPEARAKLTPVERWIEGGDLSDSGDRVLVTARGDLFNVPVDSGRTVSLTSTTGIRERLATWAGKEDELLLYVSDESGEEEIYARKARTGREPEQITKPGDGRAGQIPLGIAVAPNGQDFAFHDESGSLYWTNVTTKTLTLVDKGDRWYISAYEWSPQGNFIAYSKPELNSYSRVYIYDVKNKKSVPVTDPLLDSSSPSWDPAGDYLFFLSSRTFSPMYDRVDYEVIMGPMSKPYGIALKKDGVNPFLSKDPYEEADFKKAKEAEEKDKGPKKPGKAGGQQSAMPGRDDEGDGGDNEGGDSEGGKGGGPGHGHGAGGKGAGKDDKKEEKIDFDGIERRIFEFPVDAGDYYGLTAVAGRVYFLHAPLVQPEGDDDESMGFGGIPLKYVDYTKDEPEVQTFARRVSSYATNRKKDKLWYMSGSQIRVTDAKAPKANPEDKSPNLAGVTLRVDPRAEWLNILEEVYRLNREYFYDPAMAKIDWREVVDRYKPLVARVGVREELSDIIGNVIGELGHGHTYVMGNGDAVTVQPVFTGVLGADFKVENERVRLVNIQPGEPWQRGLISPLERDRGLKVPEGYYLHYVDGEAVTTDRDPLSYFWGKAGKDVLITVGENPNVDEGTSITMRIKPANDDGELYYHNWLTSNRAYVGEKSNGEFGYIHLPDMSEAGLVSFFKDFYPQLNKKALVIDIRSNGGGNVSQLLIARLRRVLYAFSVARNFRSERETYPYRVFLGPMVVVMDENAGSDGDIFPFTFRHFKLGPLIGTRTWGGVVGISGTRPFTDGGRISVPEFSFENETTLAGLENYGVEPDIKVEINPADFVAGRDPQLDRAIEYLKGEVGKPAYKTPAPPPPPDRTVEHFRKRSEPWMKKP